MCVRVCTDVWMCEHRERKTHTHKHTQWISWWLSVLLFNPEGCRRHKVTQYRGLMDQRPVDLESRSEYWSPPPRILTGEMCVCVCERHCGRERERNQTCVAGCVCPLWQRKQERRESSRGMRVGGIFHLCACLRNCLSVCVSVYASAIVCICLRLLILCSLWANHHIIQLYINLVDVQATMWNPSQGIGKHSARNNRHTSQ